MKKILVLIVLFNVLYARAQQSDQSYFEQHVIKVVMDYNAEIGKLGEALKLAKASNSADTIALQGKRKETVYACFQVPQDFVVKNPASPFCIAALTMLGEGGDSSPVQLVDLERLFNSLAPELRNNAEGRAYAAKLASLNWLNRIKKQLNDASVLKGISGNAVAEQLKEKIGKRIAVNPLGPASTFFDTDSALMNKIKPSVLIVNMAYQKDNTLKVNTATAYVIAASGICVTNYHVMREYSRKGIYTSLSVTDPKGKVYPVTELLSCSESDDLAVFKVDTRGERFIALPLGEEAEKMRPVYVLGHPKQDFYQFTTGQVTENYSSTLFGRPCKLMNITAEFNVGSSGGPIVDGYGNVVGTVSRRNDGNGMKMGIPVSELRKLIE
ncbi:S1 family peptidase [Pedobacter ginsengisoli]|uniref:S1 family peptidase n=1 Tax=Pedobacter ginsengisoli TaxID=363852 RepID=UPI002550C3FF|nr:serine protease [Pedobacter ginsengisoli]